jgi:hypothetical protein
MTAFAGAATASPAAHPLGWAGAKQTAELNPSEWTGSDNFGYAVAMSANGRMAVVGAKGYSNDTGAVFVYTKSKHHKHWKQTGELKASDGANWTEFGETVSLSGNGSTVVVGSPGANNSTGAAYVFTRSDGSWTQTAELTASDGANYVYFGQSVSVTSDGSTALVGAYDQGTGGAAYVFGDEGGSWTQTAELTGSDTTDGDSFGLAVALSGDGSTATVGALHHSGTGAVYLFGNGGGSWTQSAELSPSDGTGSDYFGGRVAISRTGSVVVAGAYGHNSDTGAAYVFSQSGESWTQAAELTASDGTYDDYYGTSVALNKNGSVIAVGAESRDSATGAEYVYTGTDGAWSQSVELTASDGAQGDYFGVSAAMSAKGSRLVVGAEGRFGNRGMAYLFKR